MNLPRRTKVCRVTLAAALLAAVIGAMAPVRSSQDTPTPMKNANLAGLHSFDFLIGQWQVHHRRLKECLANSHEWMEFEGCGPQKLFFDAM